MGSEAIVSIVLGGSVVLLLLGAPVGPLLAFSSVVGIYLLIGNVQAATSLFLITGFDVASSVSYVVIPMFIFMGALASYTGIVQDLYDAAYKAVGRIAGGLAVATCLAAVAFGTVTGSSISAASAMTKVALPEMRKYGYHMRLSTGIIAISGTFAMMIPPSLIMVFYGIVAQQSIGKLLIAGIIPGLVTALVYCILILIRAFFNPGMAPPGPRFPFRDVLASSIKASPFSLVLIVLIGGILLGLWTPTEGSAAGVIVVALIGILKRNISFRQFFDASVDTVTTSATVLVLVMGSVLFGKFLALSGVTVGLSRMIVSAELSSLQLFMVLIIFYIILGMFLEGISILALTVPIVLPITTAAGWDPIWFGVMLVKLIEIGAVTPPVGLNLFAVKSVAPDVNTSDIIIGALPFWLCDIGVLFLLFYLPELVTFLPSFM